jgi:FkbH-like protein
MHFITSNFNNLNTNYLWNKLKSKYKLSIDNNYDNFYFSINNDLIFNNNQYFHILLYCENNNYTEIKKKIINLVKKKINKSLKKTFHIYLIRERSENLIKNSENLKYFSEILNNLNKIKKENLHIHLFENFNKNFSNLRNKVILKFPFDINIIKNFSKKIDSVIKISISKPYKLIILDCDNTLWGGVLDESKIKGINYSGEGIGQIFEMFQKELKKLKDQGFILSISSKNNEKKVWDAMKERSMHLNRKDFISPKINWEEKQINIDRTLKELSLRPNDTVFIDDNKLELQKVKHYIPNINTIHVDDISKIFDYLNNDLRFQKIKNIKEDKKKYYQYKIKSDFESLKNTIKTSKSFYKNLKQKITFHNINNQNFERCVQLFQKTNQFNFSLNRFTEIQLSKLKKNKNVKIKLFSLKDKFGDHGLVGSYIIKKDKKKYTITDFAMSCRILSRMAEDYVIFSIVKEYPQDKIYINYNKTNINQDLIGRFLEKNYFKFFNKKKNCIKYEIMNTRELNDTRKIFI